MERRSAVAIVSVSLFHTRYQAAIAALFTSCSKNISDQNENIARGFSLSLHLPHLVKEWFM
jgi:hypothetical protein